MATSLIYAGTPIGDRNEFLCLTDMWRAAGSDEGRRPVEWLRSVDASRFIEFVAENIKVGIPHLIETEHGHHRCCPKILHHLMQKNGTWTARNKFPAEITQNLIFSNSFAKKI